MELNTLLKKIRHNIFIYMFWDVPQYKAYKENNRWERVKYMSQVMFFFGGLFLAHIWYPYGIKAPDYDELKLTEGKLVEVIRGTGRGGARKIRVVDQYGKEWLFPNNTNYLSQISDTQATKLERECLGKPIVVLWKKESRLFFGSLIDAWEMSSCDPEIGIDYHKRVKVRSHYKTTDRKIFIGALSFSLVSFVLFFFNYRKAKILLKELK